MSFFYSLRLKILSIRSRPKNINSNNSLSGWAHCPQLQHFLERFILPAAAPLPSGSTTVVEAEEAATEGGAEKGPPLAATPGGCARESCWFRLTMR